MKFVMIAELLLILFSNGIRFYAVKRYIDFFAAREKCLWKYNWILYTFACIGTYIVSIIFESPNLNIISNVIALFLLACPYKIANYAQTECQFRYCGTAIPFLTVRSTAR